MGARPGTHGPEATPRELQVAELAAAGLSDYETARRLGISYHTVRTHLRRLYSRLDISTRAELVRWWLSRP